jgi:hypothetical protein
MDRDALGYTWVKKGESMLREYEGLSQEKTGYRRLLSDERFELYLWYDREGGALTGFQLCYDFKNDPHCLTTRLGGSSFHARIDDGEGRPGSPKGSPILVSDGIFPRDEVLRRFDDSSASLDPALRSLVRNAILDYSD